MLSKLIARHLAVNLREMRPLGFDEKREKEIRQCVDNVLSGEGTVKIESCPICRSKKSEIIFSRFGINILQCQNCTLGYAERFPKDTSDIYSDDDYLPIASSDYLENVEYRKKRFGSERLSIIKHYLPRSEDGAKLLDIGCGTGWFLECAKEAGFEIYGQELGKGLARFVSKRLGTPIETRSIVELPISQSYDVITMFDVLEHVPNPVEVLKHIFKLLKPGGIVLLFVPNLDSLAFKTLKEKSTLCMPVEHLYYFTAESLELILRRLGYQTLLLETKGMDIADLYSYYRDVLKQIDVARFLEETSAVLQPIIDSAGCANHMRFVIGRPD